MQVRVVEIAGNPQWVIKWTDTVTLHASGPGLLELQDLFCTRLTRKSFPYEEDSRC